MITWLYITAFSHVRTHVGNTGLAYLVKRPIRHQQGLPIELCGIASRFAARSSSDSEQWPTRGFFPQAHWANVKVRVCRPVPKCLVVAEHATLPSPTLSRASGPLPVAATKLEAATRHLLPETVVYVLSQ